MKIAPPFIILSALCLALTSCHPKSTLLEPQVQIIPTPYHIGNQPPAFAPLSPEESQTDWGKELLIGNRFGRDVDLYRGLTAYKRALVLIPEGKIERKLEIQYNIVYSYYLGRKYQDALSTFESTELTTIPPSFPAFEDLLVMLYDSYQKTGQTERAEAILQLLHKQSPTKADKLKLSTQLREGDLKQGTFPPVLEKETDSFFLDYCRCAKSVKKAQFLNAILPGAGYYYVGQKSSAWTSFTLNTLFIAASYHFFREGNYAAGIITSSLEVGWYLGGINGAGLEAKEYNQRLYEKRATHYMQQHKLFPVLMLETSF